MDDKMFEDILAIPKNIIFPDELNRYLKEQIKGYIHENQMIRKNLEETEQKCINLEKNIAAVKNKLKESQEPVVLPQFANSSQTINAKIVELSKNYREKCAELEKYKTKCSKLTAYIQEVKNKECNFEPVKEPSQQHVTEKNENEAQSEIKQLQEKLNQTTSKLLEFKNVNIQLKHDLRLANKLLNQETGEDLSSLQNNSKWKGRAQIICDLQEKNKKLREKLNNIKDNGSAEEPANTNEKISSRINVLEKENVDLKAQNQTLKLKIESLKSRCNMLEIEHQDLKIKNLNAKEQNARNLELLSDVSKKLAEADQVKNAAVKAKENEIAKLKLEVQNISSHVDNYKMLVDNLKTKKEMFANPSGNNFKVNSQTDKQGDKNAQEIIRRLEDEKQKMIALVKLYKEKLDHERNGHEQCEQLLKMEKQKTVRLKANIAKTEVDLTASVRSRYSTISLPGKSVETCLENQIELAEETIKTLQARLELEQNERKQDFQEFAKLLSISKIEKAK